MTTMSEGGSMVRKRSTAVISENIVGSETNDKKSAKKGRSNSATDVSTKSSFSAGDQEMVKWCGERTGQDIKVELKCV